MEVRSAPIPLPLLSPFISPLFPPYTLSSPPCSVPCTSVSYAWHAVLPLISLSSATAAFMTLPSTHSAAFFFVSAAPFPASTGRASSPPTTHDPSDVKVVHVLTAWHLDIGFADTIANIVNKYLDTFYTDSAQVSPRSPFLLFCPHPTSTSLYPSFLLLLQLARDLRSDSSPPSDARAKILVQPYMYPLSQPPPPSRASSHTPVLLIITVFAAYLSSSTAPSVSTSTAPTPPLNPSSSKRSWTATSL
jgi:hypothetical protein